MDLHVTAGIDSKSVFGFCAIFGSLTVAFLLTLFFRVAFCVRKWKYSVFHWRIKVICEV